MKGRQKQLLGAVLAIALIPASVALVSLRASLPRHSGVAAIDGLTEMVHVELDARAVPRIRGATLEDALSAQGFLHAQQRFFQMDLTRRSVAGELAALVGARAVPADRGRRPYEFRRRAAAWRARLPAHHRAWLEAYVRGVNAGLHDLGARPPEYLLLGAAPEPWTVEDSLLVVYGFYTMLSNNEGYERPQAVMEAVLAPEVLDFLTPSTARADRPVLFPSDDRTAGHVPKPIPPPEVLSLRETTRPATPQPVVDPPLVGPASNQWASGASRSARGDALLANDPHLRLGVPNVFYRAELYWPGRVVRGVSVPGLPGILLGASAALAWGATVSNADQSDWIVVETDARDAERYRTADGLADFGTAEYELAVAGEDAPQRFAVRTTQWGPVLDTDGLGRPLVLAATWLEDDGANLDILELMLADTIEAGLAVVARWAGPSLNWMLADTRGAIGWAVNGPVPQRIGFDGSTPRARTDGVVRWGARQELPRVGPVDGVMFTANSRTLPSEAAARLGRMWMRPLRAERIDELMATSEPFTERAFLAMQLDTRARGYEPIRDLVLEVVAAGESDPRLAWARAAAAVWNGRADADETGFRLVHAYYRTLLERVLAPLLAPAVAADPSFTYRWPLADEPLMRLLEERPAHLVTAEFADWRAFLRSALEETLARLARDERGLDARWGDVNRLDVRHPLAAVPLVGRWLRFPAHAQPGSPVSLRVATPGYGAVIRMAVSPANPASGYLQAAGGQSGHFLSRNFADLHADWARGAPTPFLAGPTAASFTLHPP